MSQTNDTKLRLDSRLSPALVGLMLAAAMFCLALNHVIGRGVHEVAPPVGLSFWRWTTAGLLMLPFVCKSLTQLFRIYIEAWRVFLLLGLTMVGGTTLFFVTLQFSSAINMSLINALQPIVTVLFAWLLLTHRLAKIQFIGLLAGFVGVVTMVSQGQWQKIAGLDFTAGEILALIGVMSLSLYAVNLRRLPGGLTPLQALFGIVLFGCAAILPAYAIESVIFKTVPPTPEIAVAVLVMGAFGSVAGNLAWNIGVQYFGPNKASIFINLIPVFGAIMAIGFLGESLRAYHVAGFALVCSGVWLVVQEKK